MAPSNKSYQLVLKEKIHLSKISNFLFLLLMPFELIELDCTYINNTEYSPTNNIKKLRRQVEAMIQRRRDWVTAKGKELLIRSNHPKILLKKGLVRFQNALHQFISFFFYESSWSRALKRNAICKIDLHCLENALKVSGCLKLQLFVGQTELKNPFTLSNFVYKIQQLKLNFAPERKIAFNTLNRGSILSVN